MKIICIGNYPPRKCGIATFTQNLVQSILDAATIAEKSIDVEVIAMNDNNNSYDYPEIVKMFIHDHDRSSYQNAADYINNSGAEICLFQHEYGIFGGNSGLLVLCLLRQLTIPIVTTFHTVLEVPNFHQKEVLKRIAAYSSKVVIMNSIAIPFLKDIYDVPEAKIIQIEHGVPDFETLTDDFELPEAWKGRRILLTFGLLGRNKGLETVIKALPKVIKEHKDVLFVILGKTHPHVVKHAGEEYREYLQGLTEYFELQDHVLFENNYVSELELMQKLKSADLYVTPYLNKAQITSGTLVYALAGGNAVVSTPYWHAEEVLKGGRGNLFDFKDADGLSSILNELLTNPVRLNKQKADALEYGKQIAWPKIGARYNQVFSDLAGDFSCGTKGFPIQLPKVFPTKHFERLTDDTGMIQHAIASIPDYKNGYSLDDNTRAIIVGVYAYLNDPDPKYIELIRRYVAFLLFLQNRNGTYCNFLTYNRNVLNNQKPDDTFGRVIWAVGVLIRYAPTTSLLQIGIDVLNFSKGQFPNLNYSRGFANTILGLYHYIHRFPDQEENIRLLSDLASRLLSQLENAENDWDWFEPILTYDNGLLPAALYAAYEITGCAAFLEGADKSRMFLEEKCFRKDRLSLIGNKKWWSINNGNSCFAQQPVDAMAMVVLYDFAYRATKKEEYKDKLLLCHHWFLGKNDLHVPLFNDVTEGCHDGLEEFEVNQNQGAESIISFLLSDLIVRNFYYDLAF